VSALELEQASAAPWGAPLLRDISLALEPGGILGLIGPNGAGKSSLLRLIAGDIPLAGGRLQLAGKAREEWPRRLLARRLAYLPQLSLLNFPYTVEEVVAMGRMPHDTGVSIDAGIVAQALAATDTARLRERLYTRLSGGEKQRVQLARVLSQVWDAGPGALLLLDEPSNALDLSHQQMVLTAVRDLAESGCAVVVASHDLNLVAGLADSIALLQQGRVAALGSPWEVFTPQLFSEIFAIDVLVQRHPERDQPLVISR